MTGSLDHDAVAAVAERAGFSGQVVVRHGDDVAYSGCFGLAERSHRAPVTERTRFGVASFTKMFTACVVAGLVSEGRLEFGTPVVAVLPDEQRPSWLPADVTVRHLLSHTSGIGDYLEEDEHEGDIDMFARVLDGRGVQSLREAADFLPLLERVTVRPAPAPLAYSSTGFVLLGLVVEHLTGRSYRSVVEERLLDPLGIGPAFPALDEAWPDLAVGYLPAREPDGPALTNVFSLPPVGGPDGGAYLTATEMTAFLHAYAHDRVVPGLRDAMLERVGVDEDDDAYGYGVWVLRHGAQRRIGHSGFDPGFECHGWHWPATDTTFAITSNVNHAISAVYDLVLDLLGPA